MTVNSIRMFTLSNNYIAVKISNYGGIIFSIAVPDKFGTIDDIVLGYKNIANYQNDSYFFGALIGRYANRIAGGRFTLNNTTYNLPQNDGNNHLHGGPGGFHQVIFQPQHLVEESKLILKYVSKDGEQGYPGNLEVNITYILTKDNELCINYSAICDQDTIVNLTNHAYFNLAGHHCPNILDHHLKLYADNFTPIDDNLIPTGEIRSVTDTPMDFRRFIPISANLAKQDQQLIYGGGFDHNWKINDQCPNTKLKKAAAVFEPNSGRLMEVLTTKPGIQFYSGNFLQGPIPGKNNVSYDKHSGLCLETQYFPNSPNISHFPSPVLKAGAEYLHTTVYRFIIK